MTGDSNRFTRSDYRAPPVLRNDEVQLWLLPDPIAAHAQSALLARAAGRAAEGLVLLRGEHGKPHVASDCALEFNRAHSGGFVLLALARGSSVGVDLETPRTVRRRAALLLRCFSSDERAAIGDSEAQLLRWWAGKEALVKAIGRGIAYGLRQIELEEIDGHLAIASLAGEAAPANGWQIHEYQLPEGYRAALAYRGHLREVRCFST